MDARGRTSPAPPNKATSLVLVFLFGELLIGSAREGENYQW